jgi:fluoroquinolone resistance protein
LTEADFSESDLTAAVFDHCDLARATFDHTVLEKADFRTAVNYSIDPEKNKIKKARFSMAGIAGLLDKYDIDIS